MDYEFKAVKRLLNDDGDDKEPSLKKRKIVIECSDDVCSLQIASLGSTVQAIDTFQNNGIYYRKIDSLPDDVLLILLSYLSTTDLLQLSR
jgi:hypothetical protein